MAWDSLVYLRTAEVTGILKDVFMFLRELLRDHSAQISELYALARRARALTAAGPGAVAEITAALRPYERELQLKQSVVRSLEYRSAARDALSGTKSQALVEAWNAQPMLAELPEPDRDG